MSADIRTDIGDDIARADKLLERAGFLGAVLAVSLKAGADELCRLVG